MVQKVSATIAEQIAVINAQSMDTILKQLDKLNLKGTG